MVRHGMMKILTEASGSLSAAYLIESIKSAGYFSIASDIDSDCAGRYLADDFITMPGKSDPEIWSKINALLKKYQVNVVIPSLDETLLGWSERKAEFSRFGVEVVISSPETIKIFRDKWLTYLFFKEHSIPTPTTSLEQIFPLIKPREGRGASGVRIERNKVSMEGMISQEVVRGTEYTIDVFCDNESKPVYIVPRRRDGIKDGKSTAGKVEYQPDMEKYVRRICEAIPFFGPINIQCFRQEDGNIQFIEINPRIAGGMALGFAATENWINLIVDHFIKGKEIKPKPVQYGLRMKRYYAEVFIPAD